MVSSEPVNSTQWFATSPLNTLQRATITSLPVTPGGRTPVKFTRAIGGHSHHVRPEVVSGVCNTIGGRNHTCGVYYGCICPDNTYTEAS